MALSVTDVFLVGAVTKNLIFSVFIIFSRILLIILVDLIIVEFVPFLSYEVGSFCVDFWRFFTKFSFR